MAKRNGYQPLTLDEWALTLWQAGRLTPEHGLRYLLHRAAIEGIIQAALAGWPDGARPADGPPGDDDAQP